ncbi:MAG: type 4a pilus biogenesis protein PilO [Sulfurovum sp.]|nr:type 4a pilus biogenesis protein PilO [Sulfurovum sp.]
MKFIEDKLENLDAYFAPKKENEKWLMIAVVAGIIAYLAYAYLLPYTEDIFNKSERNKKSIQNNIAEHTTYLNSITVSGDREFYVKKFDQDIKTKKIKIVDTKEKITFIDKNLEKLSDMLFNQKSWSKFLNSITEKAITHDVELQYIKNKYVDNNGSFGYVLEIAVGCKGEYKGIVNFINEVEQNRLVTDIYGTNFSLDSNSSYIIADINISVWGINH